MATQRQRWMAQRAESMRNDMAEEDRNSRDGAKAQDMGDAPDDIENSLSPQANICSVYTDWIDRALAWQSFQHGNNDEAGSNMWAGFSDPLFFNAFPSREQADSSKYGSIDEEAKRSANRDRVVAERMEKKRRAHRLKQELIDMGGKLRTMRDERNSMDQVQEVVKDMKRMKEEYQTLLADIAEQKVYLAQEEKEWQLKAKAASSRHIPARFESSVDCLTELPMDHFRQLGNLACIVANCNKITHVNGLAGVVPELRSLSLRDNCISDSGLADVATLTAESLEYLCIEMNEITSLRPIVVNTDKDNADDVATVTRMSLLRGLLASNNKISDLSPLCSRNREAPPFPYLERLSLYRNSVQWIPRELTFSLRWLRHLDLGRNELMTLDGVQFKWMPLLQVLILYENKIADNALPTLRNVLLKELWLNGNRFKELRFHEDLSWAPSLESLHVHDNNIQTLSSLSCIPFVRSIDLSFNQIENIEELSHLRACPYVEVFRCNDNPVAEHPDYRTKVLLAFPRLRELDGEAVTLEHHSAVRKKVYGTQSHVVEAWLDHANFNGALQRHDLDVDWHEALGYAGAAAAKCFAANEKEPHDATRKPDGSETWHAFEAMCLRHRAARDELSRKHRRSTAEGKTDDESAQNRGKARGMERLFGHDSEMRSLLMSQLKEHHSFDWGGDAYSNNIVIDAGQAYLIRGEASDVHRVIELSHGSQGEITHRMGSRPGGRSGMPSTSSRPNSRMTAAASAAVMFQCLYRGFSTRKRLGKRRHRMKSPSSIRRVDEGNEDGEEEFAGVDLDSFMGFSGEEGLEADEFDIMQAKFGPGTSYDTCLSNASVRADAWANDVAPATAEAEAPTVAPASLTYYQQERKVQAKEQRVEKVATEWGFEDKKTAQMMMMRQSRFQRAKRERQRRAKLKDPEYKYKVLMRKVREAKERDSNSAGVSRPSNSRSAVQRDRANHMRRRKVRLPAWASREADDGSSEKESTSDLRLESAGSNVSSTPFKVVEWGPKDILPPI
eukprot:g4319.t1